MSDLGKVLAFFDRIGLRHACGPVENGFFEGVSIAGGMIRYVAESHVGDLLHEAGHIAVTPSLFREHLGEDIASISPLYDGWFTDNPTAFCYPEDPVGRAILQAGEAEAMAWSYAAAVAAGVNPRLAFAHGFQGQGKTICLAFSMGKHMGVHGLACGGMTVLPKGGDGFPKMVRWLQI